MINKYQNPYEDKYPFLREDTYTHRAFLREDPPLPPFKPTPLPEPVRLPIRIPLYKARRITSNIFACGCCGAWNVLHYDY